MCVNENVSENVTPVSPFLRPVDSLVYRCCRCWTRPCPSCCCLLKRQLLGLDCVRAFQYYANHNNKEVISKPALSSVVCRIKLFRVLVPVCFALHRVMLKTYSFAILVVDVCGLVLKVERRRGDHFMVANIAFQNVSVTVLIPHAPVATRTSVAL